MVEESAMAQGAATMKIEVPGEEALRTHAGEAGARVIVRVRDELIRQAFADHGGRPGEPDPSVVGFESVERALACAHVLQASFAVLQPPEGMANLRVTISASEQQFLESTINGAEVWLTGAAKIALGGSVEPPMAVATPGSHSAPPAVAHTPVMADAAAMAPAASHATEPSPDATIVTPAPAPASDPGGPRPAGTEDNPIIRRTQSAFPEPDPGATVVDVPRIVPRS
ncbi:hypothetical protein AYO38_06110 [bacterium SCGC AG-212-C10]|nr:hypothetical protein AYO38_06110 [bacterium SCGC AG-212-C10]